MNVDLYVDALSTKLFQICLLVSQALGEGLYILKCLCGCLEEEMGELVQPGGSK